MWHGVAAKRCNRERRGGDKRTCLAGDVTHAASRLSCSRIPPHHRREMILFALEKVRRGGGLCAPNKKGKKAAHARVTHQSFCFPRSWQLLGIVALFGGKIGIFKRRDEAVRGLEFGLHRLPQQNTDYCLSRRREGESAVLNKSPQSWQRPVDVRLLWIIESKWSSSVTFLCMPLFILSFIP